MARLLLIDDTKIVHQLVRIYLTGIGCDFDDAFSGKEGLAKLASQAYDLTICDLAMADVDGLDICRQVRARPETATMPLILLTSQTAPELRVAATRIGVNEFLNKPIDGKELDAAVRRCLNLGPASA